ncbi:MAG TPA: hypothetical protein VE987_03240 [Polyangiaceae bacterium]|nr:hypothetical protein [Polyangiaceae bacterium]
MALVVSATTSARAQDAGGAPDAPVQAPSSEPGAAQAPSPAPPPSPSGSPGPTPTPEASDEMVFHVSRSDMESLASGSMQQTRVGGARARYALNIFGDVDFFAGSANSTSIPAGPTGTHPSFALGTLSFLITGELERHFVSTAEFALEYDDQTNQVGVDVERLHVGWLGEHFFLYAGRVHTAFGYWNNAYHHGKWLQPNEERPRWVAFEDEGGLLPIHTVGLSGGSVVDVGPGQLKVTLSVSNGRGNVVDDIRNRFDYLDSKAVHGQLELVGVGAPDLRFGVSGMYDRIAPANAATRPALPDTPIDEFIVGAHVAYPGYPTLLVAEGYCVAHQVPGHTFLTYGGFVTVGRAFGVVTPYVRGQWIGTHGGSDPFFVPDPTAPPTFDELEGVAGVRVDLTAWTAVRAEYRATQLARGDVAHLGVVQWSWGF